MGHLLAAVVAGQIVGTAPPEPKVNLHPPGICEREAIDLLGIKPARIGKGVPPPKKMWDVRPKFPDSSSRTLGAGMWIGEALIDENGDVTRVWTIREPRFTPAFPEFSQSIVGALRQWKYEPTVVGGTPAPVCMTVTLSIH